MIATVFTSVMTAQSVGLIDRDGVAQQRLPFGSMISSLFREVESRGRRMRRKRIRDRIDIVIIVIVVIRFGRAFRRRVLFGYG